MINYLDTAVRLGDIKLIYQICIHSWPIFIYFGTPSLGQSCIFGGLKLRSLLKNKKWFNWFSSSFFIWHLLFDVEPSWHKINRLYSEGIKVLISLRACCLFKLFLLNKWLSNSNTISNINIFLLFFFFLTFRPRFALWGFQIIYRISDPRDHCFQCKQGRTGTFNL